MTRIRMLIGSLGFWSFSVSLGALPLFAKPAHAGISQMTPGPSEQDYGELLHLSSPDRWNVGKVSPAYNLRESILGLPPFATDDRSHEVPSHAATRPQPPVLPEIVAVAPDGLAGPAVAKSPQPKLVGPVGGDGKGNAIPLPPALLSGATGLAGLALAGALRRVRRFL